MALYCTIVHTAHCYDHLLDVAEDRVSAAVIGAELLIPQLAGVTIQTDVTASNNTGRVVTRTVCMLLEEPFLSYYTTTSARTEVLRSLFLGTIASACPVDMVVSSITLHEEPCLQQ